MNHPERLHVLADSLQPAARGQRVGPQPAWPPAARTAATIIAAVLFGTACALVAQSHYPGGGDAPYHILSARAWTRGAGFDAASPMQTKYPPGWTLTLAAASLMFGDSYASLARFTAALFPLVVIAAWMFTRRRAGSAAATWVAIGIVLSPACFDAAVRGARSEVLFTAVTIAFLGWAEPDPSRRRTSAVSIAWGGLLLVTAVSVRSIGVALALAVIVSAAHLALTRSAMLGPFMRRTLVPVAASFIAIGAWKLLTRVPLAESYPGELMNMYGSQFRLIDPHRPGLGSAGVVDILARVPRNLRVLSAHAAEILTNLAWISPSWTSPLVVVALMILALGLVREVRRGSPLPVYYTLGYCRILALWPFDEGRRFLVPVFPLLLLFARSGVLLLADLSRVRSRWVAGVGGATALIEMATLLIRGNSGRQAAASFIFWGVVLLVAIRHQRRFRTGRGGVARQRTIAIPHGILFCALGAWSVISGIGSNLAGNRSRARGYEEVGDWLSRNSAPTDLVMAQRHLDFELTADRRGAVFPVTADRNVLATALRATHTRFVVVYDASPGEAYYFPLEADRLALMESTIHRRFERRFQSGRVSVYEVPGTNHPIAGNGPLGNEAP